LEVHECHANLGKKPKLTMEAAKIAVDLGEKPSMPMKE